MLKHIFFTISSLKQEALWSIQSAGQRAYTEYSSFVGSPKGVIARLKGTRKVDKLKIMNYNF